MRNIFILPILFAFTLVQNISSQIQLSVSQKIGEKGGTIILENDDATMMVILTIPEGALYKG